MSERLKYVCFYISNAENLTYLSRFILRDGVGTLSRHIMSGQVVKASTGHIPQPFLIRDGKN